MSAPFELPDTISIYSGSLDLKHADIPGRVVPCFINKFEVWSSGTNTQVTTITHWVDFDVVTNLFDAATRVAACHYGLEYDGGDVIIMQSYPLYLSLQVLWYEFRYTNTDKAYVRAYCGRISQSNSTGP